MIWTSKYFCGHEISKYGLEHGYVDYRTLALAMNGMVLNNDIIPLTEGKLGYWAVYCGEIEDEDENPIEFYQHYIINDNDFNLDLLENAGETVFYNMKLDMYVWAISHWGTAWDYVLTNIKLELEGEEK